jgi:hypothetical protein
MNDMLLKPRKLLQLTHQLTKALNKTKQNNIHNKYKTPTLNTR